MARKPLLDSDQEAILATRIFLSQETGLFSLTKVGDGWELSVATLHRYKSPEYREASRRYSKRAYIDSKNNRIVPANHCVNCLEKLKGHPRCQDCTILLHDGSPFGHSDDGKICTSCFDSRERKKMKLW